MLGPTMASILTSGTTRRRGSVASLLRLEISNAMTIYKMIADIRVDLMTTMYTDTTRGRRAAVRGDIERHEDIGRTVILFNSGVEVLTIEIWV